ncbi:NAD(P)-binding oxidoreductase [Cognatiyoonia sp. IB215446]|uniref:NAD(P)-dependent oxidoreductase n=1 Tax=Cognatiyoonia sp. IB215446 TaxID=3097355 RepID=UPI002A157445|nr:NAD(P)-binding oxidoreductase [Cognatiyoonia sp. IB215446]MDX8348233.1 NAD(P)-binding oxidoreductase [Cognatiyoonia sp. IB215446]
MTKRVLIMGATSGIGKCTVEVGLAKGLIVRAFSRRAAEMAPRDNLEAVAGDALVAADVAGALDGMDAVIYALGVEKTLGKLWKTVTLFSASTEVLLPEMERAGVKRLLVVTGFGAGRSRSAMSTIEQIGHRAILGRPYADKDVQEEMIMQSPLDWTIVRPVILTDNRDGRSYQVLRDPATWRNGLISRWAVAEYLIAAASGGQDIRGDVVLTR